VIHLSGPRRGGTRVALVVCLAVVALSAAGCNVFGNGLTGRTWQLAAVNEKVPPAQQVIAAADVGRYTIDFADDGTAQIKADCNQVAATYTTSPGGSITIAPGASTLVACPEGSLDTQFLTGLALATSYNVHGANLTMFVGNGGNIEFLSKD
jgi:heat shock protein HslJ